MLAASDHVNSEFVAEQTVVPPKHRVKWWDCEDLAHPPFNK